MGGGGGWREEVQVEKQRSQENLFSSRRSVLEEDHEQLLTKYKGKCGKDAKKQGWGRENREQNISDVGLQGAGYIKL